MPAAHPSPMEEKSSSSSRLKEGSMEKVVKTFFSFLGVRFSCENNSFAFCELILASTTCSGSVSGFFFSAISYLHTSLLSSINASIVTGFNPFPRTLNCCGAFPAS